MSFFFVVFEHLIFYPAALLCYLPMKNQLRYSRRKTLLYAAGGVTAMILAVAALKTWVRPDLGNLEPLVLLLFFLGYHRTLRVPVSKSMGVFSIVVALLSIFAVFSMCVDVLRGLDVGGQDAMRSAVFYNAAGFALISLFVVPGVRFSSRMVDHFIPNEIWYTYSMIFAMIFALNFLLRALLAALHTDRVMTCVILAMCVLELLFWMILLNASYSTVRIVRARAEAEERNRLYEMEERQFISQQRYIKSTEKTLHDFRHNIHALQELYDAGDYPSLGSYLRQYADTLPEKESATYTANTALNALLNYYARTAALERIALDIRVSLPKALPVSDVELCGMIGNILENAVMAAARSEERMIRLDALVDNSDHLYIVATNSFDGVLRKKDGVYLSTSHGGAGIGLASIVSTAEKYGGIAQFSDDGRRFYTDIAIPLTEKG